MDRDRIASGLATIKDRMPEVYAEIQRKARDSEGVYRTVRAGLGGEPNCFWACEKGWVVGTPFALSAEAAADVGRWVVRFGASMLILWPTSAAPNASAEEGAP